MPKDRYEFDKKADKTFDDYLLDSHGTEEMRERRAARLAKAEKKLAKREARLAKKQTPEERAKKKGRIHIGRIFIYVAVLGLVVGVVGTKFVKLGKLQSEKHAAEAQLKALEEDKAQKEEELKELDSDEYIEDAARSELHMIKVGETMYVVNGGDQDTSDAGTPDSGAKPE